MNEEKKIMNVMNEEKKCIQKFDVNSLNFLL